MRMSLNEDGTLLKLLQGNESFVLPAFRLFYLGMPTSLLFKEKVQECFIYRDKLRIVHVTDGIVDMTINDIEYSRMLSIMQKRCKEKWLNKEPRKGLMDYRDFIGGYFNRKYSNILIFEDGRVAYDFPSNENLKSSSKYVLANINEMKNLKGTTDAQQKAIREIRMRL